MALINNVKNMLGALPVFGDSIVVCIDSMFSAFNIFEMATNDAVARFLGGALPCTVRMNGTECSGLSNNGGFAKVLNNVLDSVPELLLPNFAKSLIRLGIQLFVDPTMDVLFGGVVVNN